MRHVLRTTAAGDAHVPLVRAAVVPQEQGLIHARIIGRGPAHRSTAAVVGENGRARVHRVGVGTGELQGEALVAFRIRVVEDRHRHLLLGLPFQEAHHPGGGRVVAAGHCRDVGCLVGHVHLLTRPRGRVQGQGEHRLAHVLGDVQVAGAQAEGGIPGTEPKAGNPDPRIYRVPIGARQHRHRQRRGQLEAGLGTGLQGEVHPVLEGPTDD